MSATPCFSVSEADIDAHTKAVVSALDVVMRPNVNEQIRYGMLQVCQDFKEKYPLCLSCGLQMANRIYPDTTRYFGLQIVEHVIKFLWTHMSRGEKDYVKTRMQSLILNGLKPVLVEKAYIKDVTARIMVELIKNEWPFSWLNLLMDLNRLAVQGEVNTEIVMLTLLRLSEDVVTLEIEKGPAEMCVKIKSALKLKMSSILSLILSLLEKYVVVYRKVKSNPTESYQAQSSCRCAIAALKTLADYLGWIDISHITEKNCKLLHTVLLLLNLPALQLYAAECLCNGVEHVSKFKCGKLLITLLDYHAMRCVYSAAETARGEYLTESKYLALKKICELVCLLGSLLSSLVGTDSDVTAPSTFEKYLNCLFHFTTHSSQTLRFFTHSVWLALFNNPVLNQDPKLLSMLPNYISAALANLQKVGFPSKNDDPSCEYARFDFAGDDDFREFFAVFHAKQREVLKVACRLDSNTAFQMASEQLKTMVSTPDELRLTQSIAADGQVFAISNYVIRSEALTYFIETVVCEIFQVLTEKADLVENGVELLRLALNFKTTNPFLLFCSLTNVATLCPFLLHKAAFSSAVLRKFLAIITTNNTARQPELKNLRKYACATFTRICRENATLFLNEFQILYESVKPLVQLKNPQLTVKEKCFLLEALALVSIQFKDYDCQKPVLEEVLSTVTSFWLSEEMQRVLLDPKKFINFIGANLEFSEQQIIGGTTIQNCSQISYCTSVVLVLLNCSRVPSKLQEAKDGSFVIGCKPNGDQMYLNPCSELVLKLLERLFDLIRILQNLFLPDMVSNFSHSFVKVLDVPEMEKPSVHELPNPLANISSTPIRESRLERKQRFLITLYENCFHILGLASELLKQDFYNMDDLANRLLTSAFVSLTHLSDHRISIMLKQFVEPLVLHCPPELYPTLLVPVLGVFLNSLHERLTNKWFFIDQWNKLKKENNIDEIPENCDILENHTRQLTREVMALVSLCCFPNPEEDASAAESNYEKMVESETPPPPLVSTELTELGQCLMKFQDVRSGLMILAFSSLTWEDNFTCYQSATKLCWSLFNKVVMEQLISSAVLFFYSMILKGLEAQGEHKVNCAALVNLAFQFYVTLRPRYSILQNFMRQVPDIMIYHLDKFDVDLSGRSSVTKSPVERKKNFIELLRGYIKVPFCEPSGGGTSTSSITSNDQSPATKAAETSTSVQIRKGPLCDSAISENVASQMNEQKDIASSSSKKTSEQKSDVTLVSVEDEDEELACDPSPPVVKSEDILSPSPSVVKSEDILSPPPPPPSTLQRPPFLKNEQLVSAGGDSKELKDDLAPSLNPVDHSSASGKFANVHYDVSQTISSELEMESCLVSVEDDCGDDVESFDEDSEMACEPSSPPETIRDPDSRSRKWRFHSPPRDNVKIPTTRVRKSRFDVPPPGLVNEQLFPSGQLLLLLHPQESAAISAPPFKKLMLESPLSVKTDNYIPPTVKAEKIFGQLKKVPVPSQEKTPEAEDNAPLVSLEDDSD